MADDKKLKALDNDFISLKESYELRYWCKALSVSPEILFGAVNAVGSGTDKVKAYLVTEGWVDSGFFD